MSEDSLPEAKKPAWPWVLVSCGCLAAFGLVLLVAAAVLIPGLGTRHPVSYDTCAIGALRAYSSAQTMYIRNDWNKNEVLEYATPYTRLHTDTDAAGLPIQLIDPAMVTAAGPGGTPKYGYLFQDMQTIAGQPIDWKKDYALCATPAVYGKTGWRTFIICTDGTTYGKDLGRSQFVADYPKDLAAGGWIIAE